MKTIKRRFIAGFVITILTSIMNACSPVVMAPQRPRPVVVVHPAPQPVYEPAPAPVPTVIVPAVPVWAPPYTYVTEVHYYYFPDYMVYYNVFAGQYVYYNGFSWLSVGILPSMPMYYGFDPYRSYIVVLDRYSNNPWYRHDYYQQQYPTGYYNTTYAPRQSLGSNTVLRAYDENQRRPLFVDRQSNREVPVKYDVVNAPRGSVNSQPSRNNTVQSPRGNSIVQPHGDASSNDAVRTNPVYEAPRNAGIIQNSRGDDNSNTQVRNNTAVPRTDVVIPRTDMNADRNPGSNANPRSQVNQNSVTPRGNAVSETPARINTIQNPSESAPRRNNVAAPARNVTPVRGQTEMRTTRQEAPSMQIRKENNVNAESAKPANRKELRAVDAGQKNVRRQNAERVR